MPAPSTSSFEHAPQRMNGFALLLIIGVTGSIACGSTSTSTNAGPTPMKCAVAAIPNPATFPAGGGSGELLVSSARECSWSASSSDAWISLTPPTAGQGNGTVHYSVAANPAAIARRGSLVLGSQSSGITQEAALCQFELDRRSLELGAEEQTASVNIRGRAGCAWTAKAAVPWLVIVDGAQGSGSGRVSFHASSNPALGPRSGWLDIAGVRLDVRQRGGSGGAPCSYDVDPDTADIGPEQTTGKLSVRTMVGCAWTATADQPWLLLTAGATGSGAADVQYRAGINISTSARTATIAVQGSVFSLRQAGCSYSIRPTSESLSAWGGSGRIDVQTQAPCPWSADTTDSWIIITSARTGSGSGGLTYAVDPNARVATRTGIITVSGEQFTVTQGGATRITGVIHSVAGACPDKRFIVNARRVHTTHSTDYEGGTCGDLRDGVTVTVKGIIGSDGVLTPSEIAFM